MTGRQRSSELISIAALVIILLLAMNPIPGKADDTTATASPNATTAATGAATASPTANATATAKATTQPPTPIYTDWSGNFVVKTGVPFLWLRYQPSSYANVITTLYPGRVFTAGGSRAWDGVQWWGYVTLPLSNTVGWVELSLIERAAAIPPTTPPTPSIPKEAWNPSTTVRVKEAIPFVWLRADANSYAGVLVTAPPRAIMVIASNGAQSDTRQWWWPVLYPTTGVTGWVEQASLEVVTGVPVTPNPVPTPAPWLLSGIVRVRSEVPFSWLRQYNSSWSSPVYTAKTGDWLQLVASAQFDGIQWWWKVKVLNTAITGWVEQKSLELPAGAG